MIRIDQGEGKQTYQIGFDAMDVVNVVPDALNYMLEWTRARVLAYSEYRGWTVREPKDTP